MMSLGGAAAEETRLPLLQGHRDHHCHQERNGDDNGDEDGSREMTVVAAMRTTTISDNGFQNELEVDSNT
jgi:hypothetical protein